MPTVSHKSRANEVSHEAFDYGVDDQCYDDSECDFSLMDNLIPSTIRNVDLENKTRSARDVGHAPLLSQNIIAKHTKDLIPQFGFFGCIREDRSQGQNIKIFHNTNVPFSSFICGVQGSGKSHTTATMVENTLIPSKHLGRLKVPAAALVFSYSDWVEGGAGFEISELTHLATPNPSYPEARVKRVTVLVSSSNPAIKRCYQAPNVRVIPFKLNARSLDIGTLLALMAVDEKSAVPLYMAKVEAILRSISTNSTDGSLDFIQFKRMLRRERFDPRQRHMLDMRLNLLESFLDLDDEVVMPDFLPGEITIMDLSDPFVTPTTACMLFKLGLDRFLRSPRSSSKIVVLDEAHKARRPLPF